MAPRLFVKVTINAAAAISPIITDPAWCLMNHKRTAAASKRQAQSAIRPKTTALVIAGLFTRVPMMGTVLVAVGAVLFGGLAAFAYGWLAALVGTTAIVVLVRSVARDYAKRMLDARPRRLRALDERITRNGFGTVLVLRLIFGMAPMLNWGLGLTGVHLLHCFAAPAREKRHPPRSQARQKIIAST